MKTYRINNNESQFILKNRKNHLWNSVKRGLSTTHGLHNPRNTPFSQKNWLRNPWVDEAVIRGSLTHGIRRIKKIMYCVG